MRHWFTGFFLGLFLFHGQVLPSAYAENELGIYEIKPAVDGPIIAVSASASIFMYAFGDRWIHKRCPCDANEVNSFDRVAIGNSNPTLETISDVTVMLAILSPPILDAFDLGFSKEFEKDMWVYVETFSMNTFLNTSAKYIVQRPLPRTYASSASTDYRSFYSGHTSTFFSTLSTAAMTINSRYNQGAWPWLAMVGMGTIVALERVAAGRHFPTDVMTGAVVGTAVGVLVPYLHQKTNSNLVVAAAPIEDGGMLFAEYHF
jgi:membrane-associated phospholipid phosphatase